MAITNVASNRNGQSRFSQDLQTALIAGDHPLTRAGLSTAIAGEPNLEICGQAETLDETLGLVVQLDPDLLILEIGIVPTD